MVFLKKAYSSLLFGQVVLTFYLRVSPLACLNHLMTVLEDNLPGLLPIGQICLKRLHAQDENQRFRTALNRVLFKSFLQVLIPFQYWKTVVWC